MIPVLEQLIKLGYDVGIVKVSVPKETSVGRDQKETEQLAKKLLTKSGATTRKTLLRIKSMTSGQQDRLTPKF